MAQMIPEFYDDETTPPGEKQFFGWVAKCPFDWVVFHSLDLQAWNRSRQTEIDFLIVIPDTGILCVEIKSHERVEIRDGMWYLNGQAARSPLKQAEDATKTLHRRLSSEFPSFADIPTAKLIVFPRSLFERPRSIEFNPWEVWNMDDCHSAVSTNSLCDKLIAVHASTVKHAGYLRKLRSRISTGDIRKLQVFLRPAFKSAPSSVVQDRLRRQSMDRLLRDQQKPVVRLFEQNGRVIVNGPAGTGKSLIALEIARREREMGRVGLFCFNQPMARAIECETKLDGPRLVGGGVHSRLCQMLEISVPKPAPPAFWESEFYDLAEAALLDVDRDRKLACEFDVLVLDEVQDLLCRPRLLNLLEFLLKGGFRYGRWLIVGDFTHQIFANDEVRSNAMDRLNELRDIPRVAYYELDENCRNYRIVGNSALKLAGMTASAVYTAFMRGDGNHKFFNPKFYISDRQQLSLLESEIRRYVNHGTELRDITVLSFRTAEKSAAARLAGGDIPLVRIGKTDTAVQYGSIHEFKGLESNVIILTDVRPPADHFEQDLFYVGMTRALYSVSILVAQSDQGWFLKSIQGENR